MITVAAIVNNILKVLVFITIWQNRYNMIIVQWQKSNVVCFFIDVTAGSAQFSTTSRDAPQRLRSPDQVVSSPVRGLWYSGWSVPWRKPYSPSRLQMMSSFHGGDNADLIAGLASSLRRTGTISLARSDGGSIAVPRCLTSKSPTDRRLRSPSLISIGFRGLGNYRRVDM